MKLWVKFWQLAPVERRLLFSALGSMIAVRLGLWLMPLQRILAYLKRLQLQTSEFSKNSEVSTKQIAWAIRTVGRYLPGGGNCLVQALTGQFMLARRGYASQLQIGAAREEGEFKAHAWVECEGQVVIGAAGVSQYTPFPNLEFSQR
jgi:hypothetical protein